MPVLHRAAPVLYQYSQAYITVIPDHAAHGIQEWLLVKDDGFKIAGIQQQLALYPGSQRNCQIPDFSPAATGNFLAVHTKPECTDIGFRRGDKIFFCCHLQHLDTLRFLACRIVKSRENAFLYNTLMSGPGKHSTTFDQ
jgi:hypothetical protein